MLTTANLGNTFKIKFNLLRLLEDTIVSSKIKFSVELDIDEDTSAQQQVITLTNIRKWFDIVLDGALAYFPGTDMPSDTIEKLSNNLMMCPDEPYDHLLLILIAAKINAIGAGVVTVNRCYINSNIGDGFGNWFEGEPLEMLPTTEEWLGVVAYFDQPWWNRSDGGMIDSWVESGADPTQIPDILINLEDDEIEDMSSNRVPVEIIKTFKPVIVPRD